MKLRGLWHGLLPAETIAKRLLPQFLPILHVYYSLLGTAAQKPCAVRGQMTQPWRKQIWNQPELDRRIRGDSN